MQNVGIAVLVLQVRTGDWKLMDHMIMFDNQIERISSDLFNPQSNLESPYGDMALLSVIGYLLSRFFSIYKYIYSWFPCEFWMSSFSIPQHGPDQPICVCHLQVLRTLEEKLFEALQ